MNSRYVIDCKRLSSGLEGGSAVEFVVGDGFWKGRENCDIVGSDVRVSAKVLKRGERGAEFDITVTGTATMPCDRCLEDCILPVSFYETVTMECIGGEIDLEQYIYESIVLGLPFSRVHADRAECNPEMLGRMRVED